MRSYFIEIALDMPLQVEHFKRDTYFMVCVQ